VAATTALLMTAAVVRSQDPATPEPAPTAPPKSAPKPQKIWTEDDVATLRAPADDYLAQKAAQAQGDASAKLHGEASPVGHSSPQTKLPNSLEEVERVIGDSLEDIRDQKNTLARLSKELHEIPEDQRAERIKEIERRTAVLEESQKELKALQDRRDDLASRAAQNAIPASGESR
jgi:predicted component of viral defense system (DUF524 family)